MKRRKLLLLVALPLVLGLAASAHADSSFALRWFRAPEKTAYSGAQQATFATEVIVRIAPTMTDTNDADQIFALQGIEIRENGWNDACGLRLAPAYLDPSRSSRVQSIAYDFSECLGRKREATLPDGGLVTGLQVCTNGRTGAEARVKGIRIWGARIDSTARLTPLSESASFELPSCKTWEDRVSCPDGRVATSVSVWATASVHTMALRCAKVYERSKTPPDQRVTVGEPSWAAATLSVPLSIENTGQRPIGYHGVALRVRLKSRTCEQTFPHEMMNTLSLDEKRSLHLAVACTRDDVAASCDGARCQATVEWTFAMTSPSPNKASGSQVVTFPKPSAATYRVGAR